MVVIIAFCDGFGYVAVLGFGGYALWVRLASRFYCMIVFA